MSEPGFDWDRFLSITAVTDIGLRRSNNQDSHVVSLASDLESWAQHGHLFAVADGMGAHAAGELASKLAVDQISYLYRKQEHLSPTDALLTAVRDANEEIFRRGQANFSFHNMGTTCSVLVLLPQGAVLAHVGDSRIYRFRSGVLQQLTFDHSLVWEMRQAQRGTAYSEPIGVPKNVITRSLGPQPSVKVDLEGPFPISLHDQFLICSDGLTGRVEDHEIAQILCYLPPPQAAQLLRDLAVLRGGPDNITLILVKVLSPELVTPPGMSTTLTVNEAPPKPPSELPLGWWIAFGVLAASAAAFAVLAQWAWAAGLAGAALLLLLFIGWRIRGALVGGRLHFEAEHPVGRGPYTTTRAAPRGEFVKQIVAIVAEATEVARERDWNLPPDWDRQPPIRSGDSEVQVDQILSRIAQLAQLCRQNLRAHVAEEWG